ncbi:MAG: metallophosphoesterase family protein [Longimicrobiales bacterium]
MNVNRKEFLKTAGLAALGVTSGVSLTAVAAASVRTRRRVLRIAHLTDIHVQPERGAPAGLAACLRHAQSMEDAPDLILNGGDTIMDALGADRDRVRAQWRSWNEVIRDELRLPIEHCVGNHDVWGAGPTGDPDYGKSWALDEMGLEQPYRSFDRAGWHFVVLDSTHPSNDGWYTAKLDDGQHEWLVSDLERTDPATPIMIISHIPILTVTSFMIDDQAESGDWLVPGTWMHTDARRLVELFIRHPNVRLCVSGHMHMVDQLEYRGVHFLCNGAVSGAWWDGDYFGNRAGYGLIDLFDDGSFDRAYLHYG